MKKGLIGLLIPAVLTSCSPHKIHQTRGSYPNYSQQNQQYYQAPAQQPTPAPPQQREYIMEDACENPKIFFREEDSRFRNLENNSFMIHRYDEVEKIPDFKDKRWVFKRGESLVMSGFLPKELNGSTALVILGSSPGGKVIAKKFMPISSQQDGYYTTVNVGRLLDEHGSGDYIFTWAFNSSGMTPDFRKACMLYFRATD